jgi:predicted acyl esterase
MRKIIAGLGVTAFSVASVVALTVGPGTPAGAAADPVQDAIAASAAPGHHWVPEAATYGVYRESNVPVRMTDGVVLRADIAIPADPNTKQPAAGRFPVLLTQSPYGKDTAGTVGSSAIGIDPYFVERGYIDVVVDVRGTGASGGTFTLFDPKQTADGVALVKWAARLPH